MKKIDYKWIALSCSTLGALFSVLSGSTLLIALPDIMKDLHAGMGVIMWTIMCYMLAMTILVPAIGRVADMIGRKKMFVSGFIVFTIGSILCGLSTSGIQLLLYRIVQSIGGALLLANSTPIVADAFERKELGRAMGINAMVISIGSVIGPILGGALLSWGWRSTFYINIPIGIIGSLLSWLLLKEVDILPEKQSFDWKGTLTFSIGILLFLIALSFGGFVGWNKYIILSFVVSIVLIAAFIHIENTVEYPMLDMRLFKSRILAFAYGSNLLNGIARGAVTFLLIFYLQGIKSYDPIFAGILLAPFALAMMILSPISGYLSDKYGAKILSSLGLLISAAGLLGLMRISANTSIVEIIIWQIIIGMGSGMFFSPNTSSIMGAVPADKRGIAGGVRTMMNNAGTVISIALAMAIVSSSISPEAMQGLFVGTQVGSEGIAVNQFISGLRMAFFISFIFSILGACISYFRGNEPVWSSDDETINNKQQMAS